MRDVGIETEAHDSSVFDVSREKVFGPEDSIFHPSVLTMTSQAVDKYNTAFRDS